MEKYSISIEISVANRTQPSEYQFEKWWKRMERRNSISISNEKINNNEESKLFQRQHHQIVWNYWMNLIWIVRHTQFFYRPPNHSGRVRKTSKWKFFAYSIMTNYIIVYSKCICNSLVYQTKPCCFEKLLKIPFKSPSAISNARNKKLTCTFLYLIFILFEFRNEYHPVRSLPTKPKTTKHEMER